MALLRQSVLFILLCIAVQGGSANEGPPQFLEARPACLITDQGLIPLELERATTNRQRQIGLMERQSLPPSHGMVFLYDEQRSGSAHFWMYRTRIPLDIAWLDKNGVILAMGTMPPCRASHSLICPTWSPGVPHRMVLEVNAGFFKDNHVDIGDRLLLNLNDQLQCQESGLKK